MNWEKITFVIKYPLTEEGREFHGMPMYFIAKNYKVTDGWMIIVSPNTGEEKVFQRKSCWIDNLADVKSKGDILIEIPKPSDWTRPSFNLYEVLCTIEKNMKANELTKTE